MSAMLDGVAESTLPLFDPPVRTLDQRLAALEVANVIRSGRAQLKRDVKACRRSVLDVIVEPPGCVATMKVFDLLRCVPKVGRVKAGQVLRREGISPSKTLDGLSTRQRTALVAALGARR